MAIASSYRWTSSFACDEDEDEAAAAAAEASVEGPPPLPEPPLPLPPPPPPPVAVLLGTVVAAVAVVLTVVVVLMGDGAEAATIFSEDAANRAAVDAKRKLVLLPAPLPLPLLLPLLAFFAVVEPPDTSADVAGWRCMTEAAVERERHDLGEEEDVEEDGDCRSGPRTFAAAVLVIVEAVAETEEEVDEDEDVIVLLLIARHDDDKSAERVAVHAAHDAILLFLLLAFAFCFLN